MRQLLYYCFLYLCIFSCGTTSQINNSGPPDALEAIDLVYEAAIRYEMIEVGSDLVIVDRSMGTTSLNVEGFDFVENDTIDSYRWNKNIFRARYLDQRLVAQYKKNDAQKYFDLAYQLTHNNSRSWYELWIPKFTADRRFSIIELFFNNGKLKGKHLYAHFAILMEWKKKRYQKAKYFSIDHSHTNN